MKNSEWMSLQEAIKSISNDPKDRHGELNSMRNKVMYHANNKGKPLLKKIDDEWHVYIGKQSPSANFFNWAWDEWPEKCKNRKTTRSVKRSISVSWDVIGVDDIPHDTDSLITEIWRLRKENKELSIDAKKWRNWIEKKSKSGNRGNY